MVLLRLAFVLLRVGSILWVTNGTAIKTAVTITFGRVKTTRILPVPSNGLN